MTSSAGARDTDSESRPGDQHRDTSATANPFYENRPRISEYTAREIATLQSRLDKQLGPEYISTRPGNGGGKVHYLAAEKVINLANEVFGFNGWSSQIQNVQIDFVDEHPQTGRINLGLSTIVRVTLRDGTFHEDTGYGHCENTKGKAAAFEKAKKEAATDAMKRALRNFGNVLGNCLYDKDYLQRVAKVKIVPSKWDADKLHRHPDYAPTKKETGRDIAPVQGGESAIRRNSSVQSAQSAASFGSAEFEDDFGGNIFDETDFSHPDEVRLDDSHVANNATTTPASRAPNISVQQSNQHHQGMHKTNSLPQTRSANTSPIGPIQGVQAAQKPQSVQRPPINAEGTSAKMMPPQMSCHPHRVESAGNGARQPISDDSRSNSSSGTTTDTSTNQPMQPSPNVQNGQAQFASSDADEQSLPAPRPIPQGVPGGFVTGKQADAYNQAGETRKINTNIAFNPHAESPSIRRTQGINPGKSAPVSRMQVSGGNVTAQPPSQPYGASASFHNTGASGSNVVQKPLGLNFVNASADMNRKIGMPTANGPGNFNNRNGYRPPAPMKRSAMTDVTNIQQTDSASDSKKPRIEGTIAPGQGENAQAEGLNAAPT